MEAPYYKFSERASGGEVSSPIWRRSFTTSARAMLANMFEISSANGTGSWSAMTSLATRQTQALDSADGAVPNDNNWCEKQIRPWALARSNWPFAGSLRNGNVRRRSWV